MRNVLSLFDGMSCGQIALKAANIYYDKYYASEIDKHAIKVTNHNFSDTIQLGDITKWREWDIDWSSIDLIFAGSPCQGFSFAGKQLAFNDPRSALFFVFVDILRHVQSFNPNVYFLLENVKMKKEHEVVITRYMGIDPIEINSALVSAQNRVRLYWTNINAKPYGLFGDMQCMIPQPKDKGILLRDILESDVPDKYYLSKKMLQYFSNRAANFNQGKVNVREEDGKASCLTSSMASCDISDNFIKVDTNLKKAANQDKANCFTAGGNSGGLHSDMTLIREPIQLNGNTKSNGCQPYQQNSVYDIDGISPALMAQMSCGTHAILEQGMKIRRLTPTECKRLQTVSEWYDMSIVSYTQQYRMLGNGWTVDVIAHILSYLPYP